MPEVPHAGRVTGVPFDTSKRGSWRSLSNPLDACLPLTSDVIYCCCFIALPASAPPSRGGTGSIVVAAAAAVNSVSKRRLITVSRRCITTVLRLTDWNVVMAYETVLHSTGDSWSNACSVSNNCWRSVPVWTGREGVFCPIVTASSTYLLLLTLPR